MKQLEHPHIVKVHEYTECPIGFFMDYIDGPNLRNLSAGLSDASSCINLLLIVAETIRHAHDRGIIHRDIKPENIIATYEEHTATWKPYLTDFDLAWFSTATKLTKDAMGTTFYAAPEQLSAPKSKAAHQGTVDIYSFAQLAFFVIVGSDPIPLGLANNSKLLEKRLSEWPSEKASRLFYDLYLECSSIKPEDRINDFEIIVDRLGGILYALRENHPESLMTKDQFITEIIFSVIGFSAHSASGNQTDFTSTSGRTYISFRVSELFGDGVSERVSIEAYFNPTGALTFEGIPYERARVILNSRIDAVIRPFNKVKRRSGKQGSYETYVDIRNVPLTVEGIEYCRPVISRVIAAIEGA